MTDIIDEGPPDKERAALAGAAPEATQGKDDSGAYALTEQNVKPPQRWRKAVKVHPAAELFPPMSEAELRELGKDIKKHGLREPIIVHNEDGEEWLLDGRNRLDAMELVGIPLTDKVDDRWILTVARNNFARERLQLKKFDPYAYVISLNLHRRHLTAEQRRDIIAKLLKARPEQSNREIAKAVKADHKTVGAERAKLEATGEIPQLDRTVGGDGKFRPANKPPKAKAGTAEVQLHAECGTPLNKPDGSPWMARVPAEQEQEVAAEPAVGAAPAPDTCPLGEIPPFVVPEHLRPLCDELAKIRKKADRGCIQTFIATTWRAASNSPAPSRNQRIQLALGYIAALGLGLDDLQSAKPEAGDPAPPASQPPAAAPANNDIVENDQTAESALESDPLAALQKQYRNLSDRPGAHSWIMRRLCKGETPARDDNTEVAVFVRRFIAAPVEIQKRFRAGLVAERPEGAGGQ